MHLLPLLPSQAYHMNTQSCGTRRLEDSSDSLSNRSWRRRFGQYSRPPPLYQEIRTYDDQASF